MPRISFDARKKLAESVLRNIKSLAGANDVKKSRIADALGVSEATLINRYKKPQNLTLEELIIISNLFNVSLLTLIGGSSVGH